MAGLNKVTLIGNLGGDPEVIQTQSGNSLVKFNIATSETWGKGEDRKTETEWHRITVFGKLADICAQYLKKGSKIYAEGKIRTDKWEKDGETKYSTGIIMNNMIMLDSKKDSDGGYQKSNYNAPVEAPIDDNEDVPF